MPSETLTSLTLPELLGSTHHSSWSQKQGSGVNVEKAHHYKEELSELLDTMYIGSGRQAALESAALRSFFERLRRENDAYSSILEWALAKTLGPPSRGSRCGGEEWRHGHSFF